MRKRRIVLISLILLIVATGVFASFYGGAARTLFYISLLIMPVSLLYTLFVYFRFRIYQSAESKVIVKGEKTPYHFILSDEDYLSYTDVAVEFLEDFSTPQNMELSRSYHLTPKEKIDNRTEILCRYRGQYKIGVKSVTITDFLGLFRIRYPASSVILMTVLPKITSVEKLRLSPLDEDAKLLRFSRGDTNEPPDCEMRMFAPGDSIKLINWKVSAKKRELFVRQSSGTQSGGIALIMDMRQVYDDEYSRIIAEDKIIESALTVADYLVRKNVPLSIFYEQGKIFRSYIAGPERLKLFYSKCAGLNFLGSYTPSGICKGLPALMNSEFVIFSVQELTEELCSTCNEIIGIGGDVAIVLIGGRGEELKKALDRRIVFRQIRLEDEIADILGGSDEH